MLPHSCLIALTFAVNTPDDYNNIGPDYLSLSVDLPGTSFEVLMY